MLKRVLLLAAVAAATCTGSARADIVIDSFSTPSPAQQYFVAAAPNSSETLSATFGGVSRVITVTQTANELGTFGATNGLIGNTAVGGRFTLNTATGTTAYADLKYTYATPLSLLPTDTLKISFANAESFTTPVPFSVTLGDGTTTATKTGTVSTGTLPFTFGSFGINLSSVKSIELILNKGTATEPSIASADLALSGLSATTSPAVPAPAGLVLLLAAAPALGLARRFARKA